jgi:hypothetical protein
MPREIVQSAGIFELTNRQPTVVSAIAGTSRLHAAAGFSMTNGARVMLSTPPATKPSPSPALIACAAVATA